MQTEQLLIYLFISIGSIAYTYWVTQSVLNRAIKLAETIAVETAKQIYESCKEEIKKTSRKKS